MINVDAQMITNELDRAFVQILHSISLNGTFDGIKWKDIIVSKDMQYREFRNVFHMNGDQLNCVMAQNGVTLPFYKIDESIRDTLNLKFVMEQRLCMNLGEAFLNVHNSMATVQQLIGELNTMRHNVRVPAVGAHPDMIIQPYNKYKMTWYLGDICGSTTSLYFPIYKRV